MEKKKNIFCGYPFNIEIPRLYGAMMHALASSLDLDQILQNMASD